MSALIGTYLFGSHARGDVDDRSDLDVLAVVENHSGRVPLSDVVRTLPVSLRKKTPTVAWYGRARLDEMFRAGELFTWHIFLEGRRLYGPEISSIFSRPAIYTNSVRDITSFVKLMNATGHQLEASEANAVYECGVTYVCVRNIAMALSWLAMPRPDFSRYSPFHLPESFGTPMAQVDYDIVMTCRMAGQRGYPAPHNINREYARDRTDSATAWASRILDGLMNELAR